MFEFASSDAAWTNQKIILLQNWQWLTLAVGLVSGLALRLLTHRIMKQVSERRLFGNSQLVNFIKDLLTTEINKPIGLALGCFIWLLAIQTAELPKTLNILFAGAVKLFLAYAIIKILYFLIDIFGRSMSAVIPAKDQAIDGQLVLLATRTLKVFVILFGGLIFLQSIGLNVMSLLAGLGLGGLALALAAQDTAANLFGSITIIADKPFKVGDHIKVGSFEGTVEEIGFRSTRLRTLHQSVLTIPNSTIAKEYIDNMGMRPMRESKMQLGVVYATTADAIEDFCSEITQIINLAPNVVRENTAVYFHSFGDFSLNIAVRFFLKVDTVEQEIAIREQIYLTIMRRAQEMKIDFAFPTQTIHMAKSE